MKNITIECHIQKKLCELHRQCMNGERKLEESEKHTELTY